MATLTNKDMAPRREAFDELISRITAIGTSYDVKDEAKYRDAFPKMNTDLVELYYAKFEYTEFTDANGKKKDDSKDTNDLCVAVFLEAIKVFKDIFAKFPADRQREALYIKKIALDLEDVLSSTSYVTIQERIEHLKACDQMAQEIMALDPSFKPNDDYKKLIATEQNAANRKASGGGCCSGCLTGMVAMLMLVGFVLCLIF